MSQFKRILVTAALPYANGPVHLGHLAGAYLPADIFVRYHRLKGNDVVYICGSDEHGVPIMLRARQEKKSPQEIVDHFHYRIKKSFKDFGISFNYYGRTSSDIHHSTSQEFFRTLEKKGVFSLKKEKQLYDPEAKMFLADRFVKGTCPNCGYEEAYGDQCEKCGISLSPTDLKDPKSAVTNAIPELRESIHWYLPLAKYQDELEKWINTHPEWKTNVLGQIHSWFSAGLKDRAVTRDLSWGVPVPLDVAVENKDHIKGKVLYVWFDAPIGYISATKEWALEQGEPDKWKDYWQSRDSRLVNFIGKDNIVFHCIIFPAMLRLHGDYVLPDNVPANEFLNLEGSKLSTSRNYAVWLEEYLENFDADSLRYCLANILPETRDTDFSWKDFQARHNNELADILGNFINRTLTFTLRHFDGKIPSRYKLSKFDKDLISLLERCPEKIGTLIDTFQFRYAVREMMDVARFANKYFNDQAPWESIKSDPEKCATTINLCIETIHTLSIIFDPIIPFSTKKICQMLNIPDDKRNRTWDLAGQLMLKTGTKIGNIEILYEKIEDSRIVEEVNKLNQAEQSSATGTEKSKQGISIEDFSQIDLRIATIIAAETFPKADKLLKIQIEIGSEKRQIVAGIAKHYKPNTLIGKKIVVVYNLKPATIRGETSEGMLLAAKDGDGLSLLTTFEEIASGSKIS